MATRRATPAPSTAAATEPPPRTPRSDGASEPRVSGNQQARIELVPEGEQHPLWAEVVDFLDALGIVLDPWQMRVLWTSLLRRGTMWAAFVVGVCAPRQNGKNAILEARQLVGARILHERLQVHSAHLADTSKEGFRRLEDVLDANEWLSRDVKHIWRTNGHEAIEFRDGCRIRFRTRTRGGGRGFAASPIYFDESMYLPEISYGAMLPVISAQPDPQVWMMGSAVDQQIMDEGVVFTRGREQALAGEDRVAWFEWSLAAQTPADVEVEQATDPEGWERTNPALGIRITPEYVRAEQKALDLRTFAVERLGVGDWPRTDGTDAVIPLDLWESLTDERSAPVGPVVYAFDIRPDRSRGVISAVGRRADGKLHIEVGEQQAGTGWIVPRLVEIERTKLPLGIICDGVGPASSLVPQLLQANVDVTVLDTADVAVACGMFYDEVLEKRLHHLGQPELLHAIKGAVQRPLGDRWAWNRRNSTADISPLVACTLGVWKVVTDEQVTPMFAVG